MIRRFLFLALCLLLQPGIVNANYADQIDPAVLHANAIRKGDIAYKEGYSGKGNDRLHYVEAGEGPLIILYHGFPSFWYSWFDQMEGLKANYRVVAVDGLGAGLSAKPDSTDAYRVKRLAAQIDTLARHLNGSKRFTLIGHDWGAALAYAYAQAYPKRLNAVIGLSAPPYNLFLDLVRVNEEQQKRSTYMQLFRSVTLDDIKQKKLPMQIWQQAYGKLIARGDLSAAEGELFRNALADPEAINGGMNWYRANILPINEISDNTYFPDRKAKFAVRSMLIWGESDGTFVPVFLEQFEKQNSRLEIHRLPGINHWAQMEAPAATNKLILDFLAADRATRPIR